MKKKNQMMARMKNQFVLIFLGILLGAIIVNAQQNPKPYLMHWTTADGLSDNNIEVLIQDKHGLLWIGTQDGLNRFDGKEFQNFHYDFQNQQTFSSSEVECLLEARNGKIWAGFDGGGISIFDYKTNSFQRLKQNRKEPKKGLTGDRVYSFLPVDSNDILIGYRLLGSSTGGLSIISEDAEIKSHVLQDKLSTYNENLEITHSLNDSKNKDVIWLGGRDLFRWNKSNGEFQTFPYSPFIQSTTYFTGLEEISDSTLLVGLSNYGVWIFDKKNNRWGDQIHNKGIRNFVKTKDGKLWLTDSNGIGWIDFAEKKINYQLRLNTSNSPFPPNTNIHYFQIIDENIWIGTNNGLFCWNPIFLQFSISKLKTGESTWAYMPEFVDTITSNEWVFIDRGKGLVITDSLLNFKKQISLPIQVEVFKAEKVNFREEFFFIIGTSQGIFKWNISEKKAKQIPLQHDNIDFEKIQVWSFWVFQNKEVWIGTKESGLLKFDLSTNQIKQFLHDPDNPKSLTHNRYHFDMKADDFGNLWIGSDQGLSIINPRTEEFLLFPQIETILEFVIHCIENDDEGNMWIGTRDHGLFKYNIEKKQIENFTIQDGLPYNGVNRLLKKDSTLWFSTRQGFGKMNLKNNEIVKFDEKKGLHSNILYASRLKKLPSEKLMLTYQYSEYFSSFYPEEIQDHFDPPNVVINSVRVLSSKDEKKIIPNYDEVINLKPDENYFAIDYQGIHFFQPRDIRYFFQMEGYDENWINGRENNSTTYSNLSGGDYVFKVKAANQSEQWSEVKKITIHLQTPWHKTNWFYFLSIFGLCGIVYLIYNYRVNQVRKEENFRRQLAETEMKALRAQINPHFIFNCLNSIKSYIIENKIEDGTEFVGRFSQLIRMTLNHSKEKLIPFSKEIEAIRLYTWLEQERLKRKFQVDFDLKFTTSQSQLLVPPLLFQPYVENAIWHGLLHLEKNGTLIIAIEEKEESMLIQISDDGIGRKLAQKMKQDSVFEKPSMGLNLANARLKQINELYNVKSTVTMEDQFPERIHSGTIVKIIFPKIKTNENVSNYFS